MSEEIKKMSLFDAFASTAQTLQQAEEKAKSEKGFEKIDRFRTPDEGEYLVRVLPLAPVYNENGEPELPMGRKGFEFQLFTTFLDIDTPADKKGKVKTQHVPVIKTTQKGVDKSVDILEEYVRIAKDIYADDEDVINLLTDSASRHRIRFSNQRVMYVLDMTDGTAKGPMLWQTSTSNYKDIDTERRSVWAKEKEKAIKKGEPEPGCPLCSLDAAWPLTITRTGTKFNDTKYSFKIDRGEDKEPLTEEQLQALVDLPRIPDEIYRYTRYQLEATLEFLRQYDEKHDLEVCKDEEFLEAVEKLKGELSADDTSHFTIGGSGSSDGKGEDKGSDITLESLNEAYDYIVDQNLGKDSDEVQELREDMRQFIEDNQLDVIVKHSKKLKDLLDDIEEAYEEKKNAAPLKDVETKVEAEEEEAPAPKKPKKEPVNEPEEEEADDAEEEEEKPARRPRRRPSREEEDDAEEEPAANEEEEAPVEAAPRRPRRRER